MSTINNPQISVSSQYKSTNNTNTLQIKKAISPDRHTLMLRHKYFVTAVKVTFQKYLSLLNVPNQNNKKERLRLWMRRHLTICSALTR